jgi:hypothetical protein
MISVRDTGGSSTIGAARIRDGGGLSDLAQFSIRDADGLHSLLTTFSATAAPTSNYGYGTSSSPIVVTTNICTVTVTGGTAPYTYSWTPVDGTWAAVFPTSPSTAFRSPSLDASQGSDTTFTCEVTDADGNTATTNPVSAEAVNTGF